MQVVTVSEPTDMPSGVNTRRKLRSLMLPGGSGERWKGPPLPRRPKPEPGVGEPAAEPPEMEPPAPDSRRNGLSLGLDPVSLWGKE